MVSRFDLQEGDKISLPASILSGLMRKQAEIPWQFELKLVRRKGPGKYEPVDVPVPPREVSCVMLSVVTSLRIDPSCRLLLVVRILAMYILNKERPGVCILSTYRLRRLMAILLWVSNRGRRGEVMYRGGKYSSGRSSL